MLTGQRDADLLILEKLNDKDLLNICLVNKKANQLCSIDSFWMNRFIREYGKDAMQYKSPEKTWKKFYLQIITHFCDNMTNWSMASASKEGQKDVVEFFISKGADDWNWGMKQSAIGGHKDLIDFFIEKGADYWDLGMGGAALGGHKNLVNFFIEQGADDWSEGKLNAERGGHKELVRFFEKKMNPRFELIYLI